MKLSRKRACGCVSLFVFLISLTLAMGVEAENKKHRRRRHKHADDHYGEKKLNPISSPEYADHCGVCHFTYQPELLPAASWKRILDGTGDHFGETVLLDGDTKTKIINYLMSNAADTSSSKLAIKIMHCLESSTPLRITEIPYIRKEHHEITPEVFKRNSVGSLSNCTACHRTAEMGEYDDDELFIPE